MNSIHPRVVEKLLAQLPEDAEVVGGDPGTDEQCNLIILVGGSQLSVGIPKGVIQNHLGAKIVDVFVNEGDYLKDVFRLLSENYNLFFIEGVDYPKDNQVVVFGETGMFHYYFRVPESSLLWKGEVTLRILDKATQKPTTETLEVPLDELKIKVALSSKIFKDEPVVLTSGKKSVTAKFAKKVVAYLKEVGISYLTPSDLGNGTVIDAVTDGYSGLIVVKPKKGPVLFIRHQGTGRATAKGSTAPD